MSLILLNNTFLWHFIYSYTVLGLTLIYIDSSIRLLMSEQFTKQEIIVTYLHSKYFYNTNFHYEIFCFKVRNINSVLNILIALYYFLVKCIKINKSFQCYINNIFLFQLCIILMLNTYFKLGNSLSMNLISI